MNEIKDGGPAFPVGDQSLHPLMVGMSLRDYFAIHAPEEDRHRFYCEDDPSWVTWRYKHADAMLKAREVKS